MSIPTNPTIAAIVTEALKRAGRTTPTATQITDATNHQLQEVKGDITRSASLIPELLTTEITTMVAGKGYYSWPNSAQDIASLQLIESNVEGHWNDIAQGGGTQSIFLHPSFTADEKDLLGKTVYIAAGAGAGGFDQIIGYDNGTKEAIIATPWEGTQPDSTSRYFIELNRAKLWAYDKPIWYDGEIAPFVGGTPYAGTMYGRTFKTLFTPDREYILVWYYWIQMDHLDEAGTVFIRHLRSYRPLWLQGVATKCMQRYDEDRYPQELEIYNNMLTAYASLSCRAGQALFRDV